MCSSDLGLVTCPVAVRLIEANPGPLLRTVAFSFFSSLLPLSLWWTIGSIATALCGVSVHFLWFLPAGRGPTRRRSFSRSCGGTLAISLSIVVDVVATLRRSAVE